MTFNEMLRHSDFWRMSAFTMGISTLNLSPTAASLNTNGLLFKLYGEHMGAGEIPVAVEGNAPQPAPTQHLVGDLPRTSAGSPTYPLDMVAALSPDHKFLTVAVVNATSSAQPLTLHVAGVRITGDGTLWTMTGKDLAAANQLGKAPQVAITKTALDSTSRTLSVAPISISMYRFPVAVTAQ